MILHRPEITFQEGEVHVSARVEAQTQVGHSIPERLWISFPASHEPLITARADGFAVALLLLAMARGEEMEVRGGVSSRLLYGMREYQRILNLWFPQTFKLISVTSSSVERQPPNGHLGSVACAFSGGVDSFYTLWAHLPQNEPMPDARVSHGLFVHGFDIPLHEEATYKSCLDAYGNVLRGRGVELLSARTNVREVLKDLDWTLAHGPALLFVALTLGRLLSRFYVPSGLRYTDLGPPTGTDPRLDHLLSTETLEVILHGASMSKVQKVAAIAGWPATYPCLRVCWEHPDGLQNCCRCTKCIRTMIALDLAGALGRYATFRLPLTRRTIRRCTFASDPERLFAWQLIDHAQAVGRADLTRDLRYALLRSRVAAWASRLRMTSGWLWRRVRAGRRGWGTA